MIFSPSQEFANTSLNPNPVQAQLWEKIRRLISGGSFWQKRMSFHSDYSNHLSNYMITDYSDYSEDLISAMPGKISPLTGELIQWWTKSSGTTSLNRKYFPLTAGFLEDRDHLRSYEGEILFNASKKSQPIKGLFLRGTWPEDTFKSGIPVGLLTSLNSFLAHQNKEKSSAVPYEVYKDSATFDQWAPLYALAEDIDFISATTAAPISLLVSNIRKNFNVYLSYLTGEVALPKELPTVRIKGERLKYLRSYLKNSSKIDLIGLWPQLGFVYCWKNASSAVLLRQLKEDLSSKIQVIQQSYTSSEGVFTTLGISPESDAGPIYPAASILEFIKVGDSITEANLLAFDRLEEKIEYEVFLTNSIGLIRFRMHDIVKCAGYFNKLPLLQFIRKQSFYINLGVAVYFAENDFVDALLRRQIEISGRWILCPSKDGKGLELISDGTDPAIQKN